MGGERVDAREDSTRDEGGTAHNLMREWSRIEQKWEVKNAARFVLGNKTSREGQMYCSLTRSLPASF